jgi:hypothetical protein
MSAKYIFVTGEVVSSLSAFTVSVFPNVFLDGRRAKDGALERLLNWS